MQTPKSPTFIEKYLNIGIKDSINESFGPDSLKYTHRQHFRQKIEEINTYQQYYNEKLVDIKLVKTRLEMEINEYIEGNYNTINVSTADINYYLNGISECYNEKFNIIISKMNITHIIKMVDYMNDINKDNSVFKELMNVYFKLFNQLVLLRGYGKSEQILYELMNENWDTINLENLLKFANVLSKLKYYKVDTKDFNLLFQTKFENIDNITKLLDFINNCYISPKEMQKNQIIHDINQETKEFSKSNELKYNFRFIIENLKSNGFLLFEQYYKNIKGRHIELNIESINREIILTKHFISIIASFEETNVNRYVNDMLINIRNYLFDLQESQYNNEIYRKIKIKAESDKYKSEDINIYNRDLTSFQIFKYSYLNPENILMHSHTLGDTSETLNYNSVNKYLAGYLDIYRSFYKTRYPDREIEYDLIDSTIIVKMKFDKIYYIHMSLIQYIILDLIMNKECITIQEIFELIGISLSRLNDTFNSLLKIKIIKRTTGTDMKFSLNKEFEFTKNKLSISGLVKKEVSETKLKQREFMHDRNMIVLCNLVYYAKKNTYFVRDTIMDELTYKVPFKLNDDYINKAIAKALDDDYIKIQEIPHVNGTTDIIYQYNDE
jgi:hypothetical protein